MTAQIGKDWLKNKVDRARDTMTSWPRLMGNRRYEITAKIVIEAETRDEAEAYFKKVTDLLKKERAVITMRRLGVNE